MLQDQSDDEGFLGLHLNLLLTFQHRAGVSTYTSAFALAGTCVCGKQSLAPLLCHSFMLHALLHFTLHESSFSRSYGGILPSSLTRVFPRTLGFSPRLPVSVLVRAMCLYLEAFLDSVGSITSLLSLVTRHHISAFSQTVSSKCSRVIT